MKGRPVTMSEFFCLVCMGSMPVIMLEYFVLHARPGEDFTVLIFAEKFTRVYMFATGRDT